jgi:hypothetical protein
MATVRDIVKEVFEVVSEIRTATVGPLPTVAGAPELAATLDATVESVKRTPVTEREKIARQIFDQWQADDTGPSLLQILSGDGQSVPAGTAVKAVSVKVIDRSGQPAVGVPVFFAVRSGNGRIAKSRQTTDLKGTATVGSWILGPVAGTNTLVARSSAGGEVTVTATGTP